MNHEVIITANLPSDDTPNVHCTRETANAGLRTLTSHVFSFIGLQEFGVRPDPINGVGFTKSHPLIAHDADRYRKDWEDRIILAKGRHVEPEKGRRSFLPDVPATVAGYTDATTGAKIVVSNTHLPAHVEVKGVYRKVRDHLTGRSAMHRVARRRWRRDAQRRAKYCDRIYLTADPNFELMKLRSFVSCWLGHKPQPTFGPRTIDAVWARRRSIMVTTVEIPSDHHAVKATYRG